ncbi:MAG: hypothetical protein L0G54_14635 [Brevibacterium sp.]|nr:hypothetical protein [Brevibacterium sp.]
MSSPEEQAQAHAIMAVAAVAHNDRRAIEELLSRPDFNVAAVLVKVCRMAAKTNAIKQVKR